MQLLKKYIFRYKKTLVLTLILAAINQIFSLLDPLVFRFMIDRFASNPSAYTLPDYLMGAGLLLLASVGVAFVSRIAKNFQDYYTNVIVQKTGTQLYTDALRHAFSLPYSVFEDERSGSLLEKFNKARTDLEKFVTASIGTVFVTLVGVVFVLIYTFSIHWSIGTAFIGMIPVLGTITFFLGKRIKGIQTQIVRERSELLGSGTETIRNVELVKSLGLETQEVDRLAETNNKILALELSKVKFVRVLSFIQGTAINLLRSGLLLLIVWLIYKGNLSVGQLFSVMMYSFYIFGPMYELGTVATTYYESKASLEAVDEFLKQTAEAKAENPKRIEKVQAISFDDVSYAYQDRDIDAVKDITLQIPQGKKVAFVGPSGSGKSTIIKLLTGLYVPKKGTLALNATSYVDLDRDYFRQKIGLVLQETQLFAGTIKENLLFANPEATDTDLHEALLESQADYLVSRNPEGLDTKIGEGGIKLSGGERQRLAIARALIRKPEILIFDEATSALDSITEKQITDTIKTLGGKQGVTQILVAHRLSTIAHADTIYVLERGSIVEFGSHAELLEKKGLYSALWREQVGA